MVTPVVPTSYPAEKKNPKMTMEEKVEGRCILMGLPIDNAGRELLNWVLDKVAKQGDRIVAVHVSRKSDTHGNSTGSLIKVLNDYLIVYEGFCRLKQLILVGRICQGRSIQRVLVREAELCGAAIVVVGVGKNFAFGSSTSLAKYCAKKLPRTTCLIALHNGKIVFQRGATERAQGGKPKPILGSLLHPSLGMDPKVIVPSRRALADILSLKIDVVSSADIRKKEVPNDERYVSSLVRKFPDSPGWPLLGRATPTNFDAWKDTEAPKMSVVQWVMTLPDRSSPHIKSQPDKHSPSALFEISKELDRILMDKLSQCRWFQYSELKYSTNQFSSDNLIGKGGSSLVYKGCLPNGQEVAVKLLNTNEAAMRGFILEVDIITSLKHASIMPLIGICIEDNNLLFVYRYFRRGSLEENLHGKRTKPSLTWDMRFKVATEIAEALSYLHSGCSRPVIHRDVKSSNILLSDEFEPQLSDFNLALWAPTTSSHFTHTDIVGTFGYLAPEYFTFGSVSEKIDVYAFGVVLLELLSGRKAITDENPKGQESLVIWARQRLQKGDIVELLDPNLDVKSDDNEVSRVALAASLCIRTAARLRPQMSEILSLLRGEGSIEDCINYPTENTASDPDSEIYPTSNISSHLGLALQDVGDDDTSVTSIEQNRLNSLGDYLRERGSQSSSFD